MNNKYNEKFDLCLDYILKQIHNSWRHEPHGVYIGEAVFKFARHTKYAKQLEKDLKSLIAD